MIEDSLQHSDIVALARTTEEANSLQEEISLLLNALFQNKKQDIPSLLVHTVHPRLAAAIEKATKNAGILLSDTEELIRLLSDVKNDLATLRVYSLTMSIQPTDGMIANFSDWVRRTYGIDAVLDIIVDQSIGGGAILVFEGVYRDFSMNKKIDQVFVEKEKEIRGLL